MASNWMQWTSWPAFPVLPGSKPALSCLTPRCQLLCHPRGLSHRREEAVWGRLERQPPSWEGTGPRVKDSAAVEVLVAASSSISQIVIYIGCLGSVSLSNDTMSVFVHSALPTSRRTPLG